MAWKESQSPEPLTRPELTHRSAGKSCLPVHPELNRLPLIKTLNIEMFLAVCQTDRQAESADRVNLMTAHHDLFVQTPKEMVKISVTKSARRFGAPEFVSSPNRMLQSKEARACWAEVISFPPPGC